MELMKIFPNKGTSGENPKSLSGWPIFIKLRSARVDISPVSNLVTCLSRLPSCPINNKGNLFSADGNAVYFISDIDSPMLPERIWCRAHDCPPYVSLTVFIRTLFHPDRFQLLLKLNQPETWPLRAGFY